MFIFVIAFMQVLELTLLALTPLEIILFALTILTLSLLELTLLALTPMEIILFALTILNLSLLELTLLAPTPMELILFALAILALSLLELSILVLSLLAHAVLELTMPSPTSIPASKTSSLLRCYGVPSDTFFFGVNCLALHMEAPCSSETSVTIYQFTFHNIPEDLNHNQDHCENLKSYD